MRLFDLNQLDPYIISLDDAKFIHAFLLGVFCLDETFGHNEVELGKQRLYQIFLDDHRDQTAFLYHDYAILNQFVDILTIINPDEVAVKIST